MGRDKPPKAGQATDKPSIPFVISWSCFSGCGGVGDVTRNGAGATAAAATRAFG